MLCVCVFHKHKQWIDMNINVRSFKLIERPEKRGTPYGRRWACWRRWEFKDQTKCANLKNRRAHSPLYSTHICIWEKFAGRKKVKLKRKKHFLFFFQKTIIEIVFWDYAFNYDICVSNAAIKKKSRKLPFVSCVLFLFYGGNLSKTKVVKTAG